MPGDHRCILVCTIARVDYMDFAGGIGIYDLVAVWAPGGPLKLLVELASNRDEELPAFLYKAQPTVSQNERSGSSSLRLLVAGVSDSVSVELQAMSRDNVNGRENHENPEYTAVKVGNLSMEHERISDEVERLPLVGHSREGFSSSSSSSNYTIFVGNRENEIVVEEEMSPLVGMMGLGND